MLTQRHDLHFIKRRSMTVAAYLMRNGGVSPAPATDDRRWEMTRCKYTDAVVVAYSSSNTADSRYVCTRTKL